MLLHLNRTEDYLTLQGVDFGRNMPDDTLRRAIAFLFVGWKEPVLEGRGVLHTLQGIAHGLSSPTVTYADKLLEAAELFPFLVRVIAAGRVAPRLINGRACWRATILPEGKNAELFQALTDTWMRTCASTTLSRAQAAKGTFHTAEDAWLAALRAPQSRLALTDKTLADRLDNWVAPLYEGGRAALTFRPKRLEDGWHIDFRETIGLEPGRWRLLGQALAVAPSLTLPQPWSDDRFLQFLKEAVPTLRAAAFTVILPPALEETVPRITETAVAVEGQTVKLVRTVRLGDIELSEAEAQALLDAGKSIVFLQDAWRCVDLAALQRALEALGPAVLPKHAALPLLMADALRIAPDAQDVQNFLREMTTPPAGELPLRQILRPYQAQGVCWLMQAATHGLGVCLADDMGLGKTLQTIALLLSRPGPTLIVAPLTVLPVWERELGRWAPGLRLLRHEGSARVLHEGFSKLAQASDITLTAYGYLWRDYTSLRRVHWANLVLDEAQAIKNPATRQAQAARSLQANFRLALTGTPIENRLDDLWSLLDFLNPGLFGLRRAFLERYAEPERLRHAVSHFILRRLKSDPAILSELPPKILQEHYAPLTPAQSAAYDLALADYTRDVHTYENGERTGAVLALLTRLKQICDGLLPEETPAADMIEHSGKLLVLLPLLDEILSRGESVLLFTQFVRLGEWLQSLLSERLGKPIPFLHGGLSPQQRRAQIDTFNQDASPLPFILSLRAGAFGLTLTKANHVIHLDRWWNPAIENQATDRAHRIGQHRTVIVHHLICRGTLEDAIDRMLRDKRALADQVVAPTPAALLARLPSDTLLGLLRRTPQT